jgi:tetratricopeptide (TPR) repeat protein
LPPRTLILPSIACVFAIAAVTASAKAARISVTRYPRNRASTASRVDSSVEHSVQENAAAKLPFRVQPNDAGTRQGFEAFYNMDYARAIALFQQERQRYPNDPFVINHLLAAVLAKELNREGQLDASLYMGDKFLALKASPVDPQVKAEITNLSQRAIALADQQLAKNPKDTDALFARAVARGLATVYSAVIEKRWLGALREGLGAYHDDQHVLKLNPNYSDAKLVVGAFQYIVGSLSWWEKSLAFVADMRGNKTKGLALLQQAVDGGGEESIDASTILALFLAREGRYDEALALLGRDYSNFPHNFIFGLACADLLNASGKQDAAIGAYERLVELGEQGFFPDAHVERAVYSLGLALRGKKEYAAAATAFNEAINYPHANPGVTAPAALEAGEVYDLLGDRAKAVEHYKQAQSIAPGDSATAHAAARYLKHPFTSE